MPNISVNVQIYCATCGDGLCSVSTAKSDRHGNPEIHVEACSKCLDNARDEGHSEGYDEAEKKFNTE